METRGSPFAPSQSGRGRPASTPDIFSTMILTGFAPAEPVRRKRGRPRKYGRRSPGPASAPPAPMSFSGDAGSAGGLQRKEGSLGNPCRGFTPHVLSIKVGEDVGVKVTQFMCTIHPLKCCILSASGVVRHVILSHPSGGRESLKGSFEIVSLSGSTLDSGAQGSENVKLAVCLLPDRTEGMIGGIVNGPLVAASGVQVIVGSFSIGKDRDGFSSPKGTESRTNNLPPTATHRGEGTSFQPGPSGYTDSGEKILPQIPVGRQSDENQFYPRLPQQSRAFQTCMDLPSRAQARYPSLLPSSTAEDRFTVPPFQGTLNIEAYNYRKDY